MNNNRPRAFLVARTPHDTSSASEYGEVTHLFEHNAALPSMYQPEYRTVLSNQLKGVGFDPDEDFLILSGPTTALALTIAEIARTMGRLKLLCFDSRLGKYAEIRVGHEDLVEVSQ